MLILTTCDILFCDLLDSVSVFRILVMNSWTDFKTDGSPEKLLVRDTSQVGSNMLRSPRFMEAHGIKTLSPSQKDQGGLPGRNDL